MDTQVKDSRVTYENSLVRRRRYCPECKLKFSTIERVQFKELVVIKKSGLKKPFDREKIVRSIMTAVRKRNIGERQIEQIADSIFMELENNGTKEVPTRKIGEMIMQALAQIDVVAYIRFASVYKDFTSIKDFSNFINKITKQNFNLKL